jgi:hypothetical protein
LGEPFIELKVVDAIVFFEVGDVPVEVEVDECVDVVERADVDGVAVDLEAGGEAFVAEFLVELHTPK